MKNTCDCTVSPESGFDVRGPICQEKHDREWQEFFEQTREIVQHYVRDIEKQQERDKVAANEKEEYLRGLIERAARNPDSDEALVALDRLVELLTRSDAIQTLKEMIDK